MALRHVRRRPLHEVRPAWLQVQVWVLVPDYAPAGGAVEMSLAHKADRNCVACGGRAPHYAFICTDCAAVVHLKCLLRRPKCRCGLRLPRKVARP